MSRVNFLLVFILSGFLLSACGGDESDNPNIRRIKQNSADSPYDLEFPDFDSDDDRSSEKSSQKAAAVPEAENLKPATESVPAPVPERLPPPVVTSSPSPVLAASGSPPPESPQNRGSGVEEEEEELSIGSIVGVYSGQVMVKKGFFWRRGQSERVNVLINHSNDLQNLIIAVVLDGNDRLCSRFFNLPAWVMDSDGSGRLSFTSPSVKGRNVGAIGQFIGAAGVLSAEPIGGSGSYLPRINLFNKRDRMSSIENIQILDQPLPDFDSISVLCGFAS